MLNYKIDHFVIGAQTLNKGSEFIEKLLNQNLSITNKHKKMGTHNKVLSLGTSYLEVISTDPKNKKNLEKTWFQLDDENYRKKYLKTPRLISFVISTNMLKDSDLHEKSFFVSRNNFSWHFQKPKSQYLLKNNFKNINLIPSLIKWESSSPLFSMKKSSFIFESLEITLNQNQKMLYNFMLSLNLKEKIIYKFTDNKYSKLSQLKLRVRSLKDNKLILIS